MRLSLPQLCLCVWMLVSAAHGGGADAPAGAPALRLVLELSDGSRIIGTPSIDKLKMSTSYADMEIPFSKLRVIEFGTGTDHTAHAGLRNGDTLNAQLAATEIVMKTVIGQVTVPFAQVRKLRVNVAVGTMPEGLVLHYTFDSDDGERVADASDTGNDGTLHGATYSQEGKSGGAMSFSGENSAVLVKNSASLQIQDFTIMAWVKRGSMKKVSNTQNQAVIFGYGEAGYSLGLNNDGRFWVDKIGSTGVFSSCKVEDDSYHHLAVTKKGGRIVFYLDGTAYQGDDYEIHFEFNTDLGVGTQPDDISACFLGLIDEVAVFNRALSEDEVKGIYESQK